jgi:hypothetical protein
MVTIQIGLRGTPTGYATCPSFRRFSEQLRFGASWCGFSSRSISGTRRRTRARHGRSGMPSGCSNTSRRLWASSPPPQLIARPHRHLDPMSNADGLSRLRAQRSTHTAPTSTLCCLPALPDGGPDATGPVAATRLRTGGVHVPSNGVNSQSAPAGSSCSPVAAAIGRPCGRLTPCLCRE